MGISDFVTVTPKSKSFSKNSKILAIFSYKEWPKFAIFLAFCFGNLRRYVTKGYGVFQFVMERYTYMFFFISIVYFWVGANYA